jgi:CDP-6-deoxy-D-xylo-4-hexulose-3-dehydrase
MTDMQAAVGVAQLAKLDGFIEARKRNFQALREGLCEMEEFFILPEATRDSDPSWFGFPIAVRPEAPFSRNDATRFLEERKIATRLLFGGNLVRQPAYRDAPRRVIGSLKNSDFVMNQVFWIGVYPGIGPAAVAYMLENLRGLVSKGV